MNTERNARCFIAITFPEEVVKEVARIQEVLSKAKFTGKMTELENLHLTLKFLGEVSEEKINEVKEKLKEVSFNEFEVYLSHAGVFSFRKNPRIVWIKVNGKSLFDLQKKVDEKMSEIGFKKEERFMSHLTIARVKYAKDRKEFKNYAENLGVKRVKFKIQGFKLLRSELESTGPVYSEMEEYLFNK